MSTTEAIQDEKSEFLRAIEWALAESEDIERESFQAVAKATSPHLLVEQQFAQGVFLELELLLP